MIRRCLCFVSVCNIFSVVIINVNLGKLVSFVLSIKTSVRVWSQSVTLIKIGDIRQITMPSSKKKKRRENLLNLIDKNKIC